MPKFQVKIDQERCKGCGLCVEFCPKNVLKLDMESFSSSGYHPAIIENIEKCKGCAICTLVCPEPAIKISKEESK